MDEVAAPGLASEPAPSVFRARLDRAKRFYEAHEPSCTVAFFVAGFLFDTLFVGRIDHLHNILHQASYLFLCALFISLELRELYGKFAPPPRFKAAWRYQAGATHFMLGTLLNIYTLFYFKSASMWTSFAFLLVLAALLAVNELKPFANSATTMRMGLFSMCLISYFTYLVPVLVGSIGVLPFLGSMLGASACAALLFWRLSLRMPDQPHVLVRHVALPFTGILMGFSALYFLRVLPPVPLSISAMGVYHDVRREGDRFALTMTRSRWRFWERGDQTFLARPGDAIYCFVSVFSPTRFKEELRVRWALRDPARGWEESDDIPLGISGGRDLGWRSFTAKRHYSPGRWRVRIETSDRRELGRLEVEVVPDAETGPRAARVVWK
ncbi:MAG TPA: DUF2914 domain-containing protein [Elusimicrobiota bacterium]|nr:DUF2914 domain-containing protein [Elusimicrobiota bacterium]